MRTFALVLSLFAMLAAAVWWAVALWTSVEGPPMPASGHIAMWLGIVFSVVIGFGLMGLLFYSSRYGYDERARGGEVSPGALQPSSEEPREPRHLNG